MTEVEWVELAIVMRADEQGVSATEATRRRHAGRAEPILHEVSAEHRALAIEGAERESVTVKEWVERAVVLKAGHPHIHRGRTHGEAAESAVTATVVGEAAAHETRSRRERAQEPQRERAEARHDEREEEAERRERRERGFSTYHSHIAARAAAAEDMPLDVWMEEAILGRAGYRSRGSQQTDTSGHHATETIVVPPLPPPSQPPVPPPSPSSRETIVREGGGLLWIGIALGVLVAIVLILFISWLGFGPQMRVLSASDNWSGFHMAGYTPTDFRLVGPPWDTVVVPGQPGKPNGGDCQSSEARGAGNQCGAPGAQPNQPSVTQNQTVTTNAAQPGQDDGVRGDATNNTNTTQTTIDNPAPAAQTTVTRVPGAPGAGVSVTTQIYLTGSLRGSQSSSAAVNQRSKWSSRRVTVVRVERPDWRARRRWRSDQYEDAQPLYWLPSCGCDNSDGLDYPRDPRDDEATYEPG